MQICQLHVSNKPCSTVTGEVFGSHLHGGNDFCLWICRLVSCARCCLSSEDGYHRKLRMILSPLQLFFMLNRGIGSSLKGFREHFSWIQDADADACVPKWREVCFCFYFTDVELLWEGLHILKQDFKAAHALKWKWQITIFLIQVYR